MVFLGLEKPVEYQSLSVFNPATAQMVLNANRDYINAVYNDYLLSKLEMKEFNEKYGNFLSPILKDMDWYQLNVTGRLQNFINDLYAKGIDPLRSVEGRAMVSREIANMPYAGISNIKQSAEAAKEFIKNRGLLEREGRYDRDLNERYLGYDLSNWDTMGNGLIWNVTSPLSAKSLKELTESSFNNRTAHELTKEDVLSFGPEWAQKYDPRAKYVGFTKGDIKQIADKIAPGLYGTPYYDYYRDLAKRKVAAMGGELSEKNINAQLALDIADTQDEFLISPTGSLSEYLLMEHLKLARETHALAKKQYEDSKPGRVIGMTDRIKGAISLQVGSGTSTLTINSKIKGFAPISGKLHDSSIYNYMALTVKPVGADLTTINEMFFGFNNTGTETFDFVNGRKRRRITFTSQSGLHPTLKRAYDYSGIQTKGRVKSFEDYLYKHKIYGYPIDEDATTSWDKTHNTNVLDINSSVEIRADLLEGYFKLRYKDITKGRDDYSSEDYINWKANQKRQLGISDIGGADRKIPIEIDGRLAYTYTNDDYLLVPITRTVPLPGLLLSVIDTHTDKKIISGKELLGNLQSYLVRDIKRMGQ